MRYKTKGIDTMSTEELHMLRELSELFSEGLAKQEDIEKLYELIESINQSHSAVFAKRAVGVNR